MYRPHKLIIKTHAIYLFVNMGNILCSVSSVCNASRALLMIIRLSAFSSLVFRLALPTGWTMAIAGTILFVPTMSAILVIAVICTVGIPTRSISLESTAPQRVLVPQVEVSITADIPSALSSCAIS